MEHPHIDSTAKGKGKSHGPPPPPLIKGKGKGTHVTTSKGHGLPLPAPLKGKGMHNLDEAPRMQTTMKHQIAAAANRRNARDGNFTSDGEVGNQAAISSVTLHIKAQLLDGRELDLNVGNQDLGKTVKYQISQELGGIGASRLKLIAGTTVLDDFTTVSDNGLVHGDCINVIILSPLHGSLNRAGLDVPLDVMEMKQDVCEALANLRPTRVA